MARLSYYDKLLVAIAGSLALGMAIGLATPVAFLSGLAAGAIVATIFVYEAMFRNPPIPTESVQYKAAAIAWHAFLGLTIVAAAV
ncbi:hypothetical protein [Natronobacterium gregoryi]|uniref:Uncharacterized protein n=2 Tax=Natronobacterium gregoryi TaxID=44930 RepID=L0AKT9_NATGS|nr:hypothetical protein [Natronobacterium gregoryi]AFZ74064.1 hypothetical protein Natgr_2926 [Natronobacterium gregoryi SP2]ELY70366.1 hypothetical protein C490_06659 [Natronobacterium gregoryi SP2]PLK20806.1 hypothetical protein CYV19_07815 [Natronobacterium gregoryi SP2]SFJ06449.1 hypothetical protein SAMN05443661_11316 [Natronobacterium gregoryi]